MGYKNFKLKSKSKLNEDLWDSARRAAGHDVPLQPGEETEALTDQEKMLIVAALHACAPWGGGSPPFSLANKLEQLWELGDFSHQNKLTQKLMKDAFENWVPDDNLEEIEDILRREHIHPYYQ
jgi:hypothetical protein